MLYLDDRFDRAVPALGDILLLKDGFWGVKVCECFRDWIFHGSLRERWPSRACASAEGMMPRYAKSFALSRATLGWDLSAEPLHKKCSWSGDEISQPHALRMGQLEASVLSVATDGISWVAS